MQLTLETVRDILKAALGFNSFTAGFIRGVEADDGIPTACINGEGKMRFNHAFVEENVRSREDLFCLIFHELLHPFFLHGAYGNEKLANLAGDAVINALISNLFAKASDSGSLFRKLYKGEGLEMILRPGTENHHSRFKGLYFSLYPAMSDQTRGPTTGTVIQALKVLCDTQETFDSLLVGNHAFRESLPEEDLQKIGVEIAKSLSQKAGYYPGLQTLLLEALKNQKSIKSRLLEKYTIRSKVDRFFVQEREERRQSSPIPLSPGKRDIVLLSSGIYPVYFRNRNYGRKDKANGLAVYLDVSGSVNEHLPEILGILKSLKQKLRTIFLFSNKVLESDFAELIKTGKVQTTYGTDFDCVADSILEKKFLKAVVLTDGFADLKAENTALLKKSGVKILTLLFGGTFCQSFLPFGPVLDLKEVLA